MQHPMQRPTLRGVRLRSTRDALQIFYAVARNILPMTTRRLDAEERRAISSGDVFVWEERCANSEATGMGMERWTDGMGWGPSRVRDDFLFYQQRETDVQDDPAHPSAPWANMMRRQRAGSAAHPRAEPERLIKQTYSVHVTLPDDRPRGITRKWHLTAYFSQTTVDALDTIDSIQEVGDIRVPEGLFRSARASKGRREPTEDPPPPPPAAGDPWGLDFPRAPSAGSPGSGAHPNPPKFVLDPDAAAEMRLLDSPVPGPGYRPPQQYAPHPHPQYQHHAPAHHHPHPAPPLAHAYTYPAPSAALRDPSPYPSSASASSDGSSPHTPPPALAPLPRGAKREPRALVPLAVLQGRAPPPRDPADERLLRRLGVPAPGRRGWMLDEEMEWERAQAQAQAGLVVESEERKPLVRR